MVADINDSERADPICLLKTRENIAISQDNNSGNRRLKLSKEIKDRINDVRNKLLDTDTYLGTEGALYMMYRIDSASDNIDSTNIIPLYIGLSEAHSWKFEKDRSERNHQIQDFTGEDAECRVARDRFSKNLTDERKRLRWGSDTAYHIGRLSLGLLEPDHKNAYVSWAKSIFTDDGLNSGTPELSDEVYLWMHPWSRAKDDGPYHPNTMLNEVEPQLIEMAAAAHPKSLLNNRLRLSA